MVVWESFRVFQNLRHFIFPQGTLCVLKWVIHGKFHPVQSFNTKNTISCNPTEVLNSVTFTTLKQHKLVYYRKYNKVQDWKVTVCQACSEPSIKPHTSWSLSSSIQFWMRTLALINFARLCSLKAVTVFMCTCCLSYFDLYRECRIQLLYKYHFMAISTII